MSANFHFEAVTIDDREWGREALGNFINNNSPKNKILTLGILDTYALYNVNQTYPIDKLSLEIIADKQIKVIKFKNIEEFKTLIKKKIVDYFIFEKSYQKDTLHPEDLLKIEKTLTNGKFLTPYKILTCATKKIYIFKPQASELFLGKQDQLTGF